jgi:hypothetical protein
MLNNTELEAIKKFTRKATNHSCNAYYGWISPNEGLISSDGWYCHKSFGQGSCYQSASYGVSASRAGRYGHKKEDEILWIDWLVNVSPFKDAFFEKDPNKIYEECYVMNLNVPGNLLLGALVSSRAPNDIVYKDDVVPAFKSWLKLVKMGVDPTRALVYASFFRRSNKVWGVVTDIDVEHWMYFPHSRKEEYIYNFLSSNPVNTSTLYNECGRFFNRGKDYQKGNLTLSNLWSLDEKQYCITQGSNFNYIRSIKSETNSINLNIFFKDKRVEYCEFRTKQEVESLVSQLESWMDKIESKYKQQKAA